MGESRSEQTEAPDQQKHQSAPFALVRARITEHSDRIVPAEEDQYCDDSLRREFGDDGGEEENSPGIDFGWPLPSLEQSPAVHKFLYDQLREVAEYDHEEEYGKYLILQALITCGRHPEGEANEESLAKICC